MSPPIHLVWLRADLRLVDNCALSLASEHATLNGGQVHLVYLAVPSQWQLHEMAPIQADLIYRRLQVLAEQSAALGVVLHYQEVPDYAAQREAVLALAQSLPIKALYFNRQYWPDEQQRDRVVAQSLPDSVALFCCDDATLIPPGAVRNQQGKMFRVFTPFYHQWRRQLSDLSWYPKRCLQVQGSPRQATEIAPFTMRRRSSAAWPVTDTAIRQRLDDFCCHKLDDYQRSRDYPALGATSGLSPYLAIGALSARQCLAAAWASHRDCFDLAPSGVACWLSELAWREFYYHLMVAWPSLAKGAPFRADRDVYWQMTDANRLQAWQRGETGYVFVDAAMRALNTTGWMHNRLRMVCASFLVKDLHLDWRLGERYFMQQLIDGDLASNNGGWQWAASCGCDAQPYFRIFHPITQAKKFDPTGAFIRRWLPELTAVPDRSLYEPYSWADHQGIALAYPRPIVCHRTQRQRALARFEMAKSAADIAQNAGR